MLYDFQCTQCNKIYEIKMTMAEHTELKNKMECQECHTIMRQKVSGLTFQLKGEGWFPKQSDEYDPNWHGIDQGEFKKNLEFEKMIEDKAQDMAAKDRE
jgi:putative FmdB family regulatory protein